MDKKIRTAIVGAGKMGGFHTRVYSQLENSQLIAVVDAFKDKADTLAEKYDCQSFQNPKDIIGKVDAVTISAPTFAHLELAKLYIENGISVMIEKPLALTSQQGQQIVELAKANNVTVAVGHSERCNPVVQALKKIKPTNVKYIDVTRISPYPFRSTDIGVVLDVMIHDIDIVLWLADSKLKSVSATGQSIIADNEDLCNARLTFENGCVANINVSRVAFDTVRQMKVYSDSSYVSLDYLHKQGFIVNATDNIESINWVKEKQQIPGFDFSQTKWQELIKQQPLEIIEEADPLTLEQKAFLNAVAGNGKPEVDATQGLAALECAEKILAAI